MKKDDHMTNSYPPGLAWILISMTLSLSEIRGVMNEQKPSSGQEQSCGCFSDLAVVNSSEYFERNKRALEQIYITRNKKESEDPLNYLSELYTDMSEPCCVFDNQADGRDAMQGIIDPPQMELQFHKKVPNCDNEFNITKIVELVDEDKKQRQCPCACPKPPPPPCCGKASVSAIGNAHGRAHNASAVQPPANSQLSAVQPAAANQLPAQLSATSTQGPNNRSSYVAALAQAAIPANLDKLKGIHLHSGPFKLEASTTLKTVIAAPKLPSGAMMVKKDDKLKLKQNSLTAPKSPPRKLSNVGVVDLKKSTIPKKHQSSLGLRQQKPSVKQSHSRIVDLRNMKQSLSNKSQGRKTAIAKQNVIDAELNHGGFDSVYPPLSQFNHI